MCSEGLGDRWRHGCVVPSLKSALRMSFTWQAVANVDQTLCNRLQRSFKDPCTLALACYSADSATELVEEALQGQYPPDKRKRLASGLFDWSRRVAPKVRSEVSFRAGAVSESSTKLPLPKLDAGAEFDSLISRNPQVGVKILEQALRQRKLGTDGSRQTREELSRKRWILELAVVIREAGLPAAARIDSMSNPETSWIRAFGSRRAKTLKNRAMAWRKLGAWLRVTFAVCWPRSAEEVLQYLEERHELSPLGKTIPSGILSTLGLLELVGQVEPSARLSEDMLLVEGVRSWKAELEQDAAPVKQAPMYPIIVLLACELVVCDPSACLGARFYSFVLLLLVWATLRVDDLQNVNPASVLLSQIGMKFTLDRTKTSGAGKHVGKLQAFVMRGISLSGFDWIGYGYRLLGTESLKFERDYFCGRFGEDWSTPLKGYINSEEVSLHVRSLLQRLPQPI